MHAEHFRMMKDARNPIETESPRMQKRSNHGVMGSYDIAADDPDGGASPGIPHGCATVSMIDPLFEVYDVHFGPIVSTS